MTEQKNAVKVIMSNIWWLVLLRGIVLLIVGILLVSKPLPSLMVLVMFMGLYWFIDGVLTIIESIRGRKSHKDWGWGLFVGIISTLAGIIIFSQPFISAVIGATFLIYLIGFMIVISGVWSIITGFRLRKAGAKEWSMILSGLLYFIFGLLLLINPLVSMMTLVWLIGVFALAGGIFLILAAFRIRKLA